MSIIRTRESVLEEIAKSKEKNPEIFLTRNEWVRRGAFFLASAAFGETAPTSASTKNFKYNAVIKLFKIVGFPSQDSVDDSLDPSQLKEIFDGRTVTDIPYGPKVPSAFEIPETVTALSSLDFNRLYNSNGLEKYQLVLRY